MLKHIMIDLEMNKIKKQYRDDKKLANELIEIGAVKMDDDFNEVDRYQSYVMPDYGKMDSHIIKLTGITDEKLEGAPRFKDAMQDFEKWIGGGAVTFYSWSMADIRQFQTESAFKEYQSETLRKMEKNWIDFQEEYSRLLGIDKRIKLKQAVSSADYDFKGAQHTALADAVNTAEILKLSKNPQEFERVMKPILDLFRKDQGGSTLMDMCPEFFAEAIKKDETKKKQ